MTIYSDAIGNRFLGDCIWANHDINYPTTKFLQAHSVDSIETGLTQLCSQSGLLMSYTLPQSTWDLLDAGGATFLTFGASGDINNRYNFGATVLHRNIIHATLTRRYVNLNDNSGNLLFQNLSALAGTSMAIHSFQRDTSNILHGSYNFAGVSDGSSLALFITQRNYYSPPSQSIRNDFYYAGLLDDVNSNFNYYNSNNITKSITITNAQRSFDDTDSYPLLRAGHYIVNQGKYCLSTGDAQYPIVCADAQTPTAQWATDMYVFDDNATLGFPAIGRVRNLLLATGSYTIGKPVKIQGIAMPDAGFNRWLPVGSFSGKTVLMRCYSSVNI